MRSEYDTLINVAEGLLAMIYAREACNVITFAQMAEEARSAARHLASEIERLVIESRVAPVEKQKPSGFWGKVVSVARALIVALVA